MKDNILPAFSDKLFKNIKLPALLVRMIARKELKARLEEEYALLAKSPNKKLEFINKMKASPIFLGAEDANEQHYEVLAAFYTKVLGKRMKYSCNFWEGGEKDLDQATDSALKLVCERAKIKDGERILELGSGWGSLSLYLAENFPNSSITTVSNSHSQREYIEKQAKRLKLDNLQSVTSDVGVLEPQGVFDTVVSIEMFEHARNYQALLKMISSWLVPNGKLFVHIFTHKELLYAFNTGEGSWMAEYFFTDGLMPSFDIFEHFGEDMKLAEKHKVNGMNYHYTCEAWIKNHQANWREIIQIFEDNYGKGQGLKYWNMWLIFFIACSELFKWDRGNEWFVGHYLMYKK